MSEPNQGEDQNNADRQPATFTPPASQAELDRIISDRVNRTKAQFKDYNDLKSKAAQFDQEQERNKSELQRAQETAQQAVTEAATLRLQVERGTAARAAGLKPEMERFLTGQNAEELAEQAKALAAELAAVTQPRTPAPNFAQGTSGNGPATSDSNAHMNALIRAART